MKRVVVLSGAGISAESGLKTFRDSDGLWENYRIEDVATPQAWKKDRNLVLQFYNERRKQVSYFYDTLLFEKVLLTSTCILLFLVGFLFFDSMRISRRNRLNLRP